MQIFFQWWAVSWALVELAPQSMAVARPGEEGPFVRAVSRFSLPGMVLFQREGWPIR